MKILADGGNFWAVEAALRLKSSTVGVEVIIVAIGPPSATIEALRAGLALGANRAIAIDSTGEEPDAFACAALLALVAIREKSDLLIADGDVEPRSVTVTGILKAKAKTLTVISVQDLLNKGN